MCFYTDTPNILIYPSQFDAFQGKRKNKLWDGIKMPYECGDLQTGGPHPDSGG